MFEHVGSTKATEYFGTMRSLLGQRGRLLNHAISSVGGSRMGPSSFIGRYVESLREHYTQTLHCWVRNLERHRDAAVAEVGVRRARVWQLYMAGSANGFDDGGISVHQVLGIVPEPEGRSGMPATRSGWG